jgi:hypothetical protein
MTYFVSNDNDTAPDTEPQPWKTTYGGYDAVRIEGEAPETDLAFVNWLGERQTGSVLIHEIQPGEWAINQFVLPAFLIRRVVLASRADTVIVRTLQDDGDTVAHFFDRGEWLTKTQEPNERASSGILSRLGLK